jgi:hypothetical protein
MGSRTDVTQPPAGTFTQLAGDHDTLCAVGVDHHVACWGDVWPGKWFGDSTYPYGKVPGLTAPQPKPFDAPIALSGRIVDEHGMPIAGAEVAVCAGNGPCTSLAYDLATSSSSLAQLAATKKFDPAGMSVRTTAADGKWSATVTRPNDARWSDPLTVLATAPGREVAERSANDVTQLGGDLALRPASSLDVDLRCGKAPCTGKQRIALTQYRWFDGTHLEHLAPGVYTIEATVDFGQPGERRGTATVTVTFAGGAQHATIALKPLGTGKSIKGTAKILGRTTKTDGVAVRARCEGKGGTPIYRETKTDAAGAYELRDVGAPPCTVEAASGRSIEEVKVDKVPADGVTIEVRAREYEP